MLVYVSRGAVILGELVVLAITLAESYRQLVMARRSGIRLPVSYVLLRDGKSIHIYPHIFKRFKLTLCRFVVFLVSQKCYSPGKALVINDKQGYVGYKHYPSGRSSHSQTTILLISV